MISVGSEVQVLPGPPSVVSYQSPVVRSVRRGRSSIGRAPALQAGGRRFDSVRLHQFLLRTDDRPLTTIGAYIYREIRVSIFCATAPAKVGGAGIWMFVPSLIVGSRIVLCQGE